MARQKKVYPTDEIAHLWAHKTQDSARNPQDNLYFEGDTIYSYGSHFPIARHIRNAEGLPAVLFTHQSYSNTTAKHISLVRRAILSDTPVFRGDVRSTPAQNYKTKRDAVEKLIDKLKLAHPDNKYTLTAKTHKAKLKLAGQDNEIDVIAGNNLAIHPSGHQWRVSVLDGKNAGVPIGGPLSRPEARIVLDILDRIRKWDIDDPQYREALGKRVNAAIATARKYGNVSRNPGTLANQWRALQSGIEDLNRFGQFFGIGKWLDAPPELSYLDTIAAAHDAKKETSRAAREVARYERWGKQQAEARLKFEEKLPRWLAGENVSLGATWYHTGTAYLRVEGDEVVTSQGARVPLAHVQKALPVVMALIENGRTYQRNGHTIHLGHYAIDSINEAGELRAGCHVFSKAEIERFAGVINSLPV